MPTEETPIGTDDHINLRLKFKFGLFRSQFCKHYINRVSREAVSEIQIEIASLH